MHQSFPKATKHSKYSNVKQVRLATRLGVNAFANRLGCSVETIKRVESGRLALSSSLGLRIMLAYGVAIETLVSPGGPKHRHGLPYDHASFEQWEMRPAFTAQELEPAIRRITLDIEQLLAAAAKSRRLLPTLVLLSEFCDNTSKNFGLQFRRLYQNAACRAVERELKLLPGHGMDLAGLAERLRRILESTFTPRSIFEKKLANAIAQKRYGRDRKPSGEENKRFEALRSSAKRLMARKRGPAKRS